MALDLTLEPGLRPPQAAKIVPPIRHRVGQDGSLRPVPTHPSTIVRWMVRGRLLDSGEVVRLDALRTPGGWITTASAIREFFDAITPRHSASTGTHPITANDAAEAAGRELELAGL